MLTSNLRQVGGSVMMTVPPSILEMLDISAGSAVSLAVQAGKLVVEPKRRKKYNLQELLAKCDPSAPISDEDREWQAIPPIGRELL